MKNLALLLTLTLLLLSGTGCVDVARVARELKDDDAFITVRIPTPYGVATIVRDGRSANSSTVNAEGAVTSIAPKQGNVVARAPFNIVLE